MAKADEGTVQYPFDHAKHFHSVVLCSKEKQVGRLPVHYAFRKKKRDKDTGKEEINVFYNQEKGGVDSQDQMRSLYTTARKTNYSPMRLFYGIIDSAALSSFVIFTENVPNIGERKKEKRQIFLKELVLVFIIPHTRHNFEVQQTPQDVKTGHSQMQQFTGTLTSSKHHPVSFSTEQEMLHLSQIKGQEKQTHL